MYYTYVIESQKNKYLYKGFCSDLKRRLKEHNNGDNKSTRNDRPWQLIHYEAFQNKADAIEREISQNRMGKNTSKKDPKELFKNVMLSV